VSLCTGQEVEVSGVPEPLELPLVVGLLELETVGDISDTGPSSLGPALGSEELHDSVDTQAESWDCPLGGGSGIPLRFSHPRYCSVVCLDR
jgi:hypothetical protein